jgi:N-acyl-D-amino-acid deacylase
MHDLVLRGGLVVDGSSREPFVADVAITGQDIVAIGADVGAGAEEIDAHGLIVTPGFIDLHTHLDPYAFWKPEMDPAVFHGITTVLMGNCSVSLAPCMPENRAFLAEIMTVVEEVPKATLMEHLPWTWTTYGEYLDALERCHPAINLCGLASLAALRVAVVGEERCFDDTATFTEGEVTQIAALAADSVRGGAFGVSCIRNRAHRDRQNRPPPGNYADLEENRKICEDIVAVSPEAIWQTIPNMGAVAGRDEHDPGTPTEVRKQGVGP